MAIFEYLASAIILNQTLVHFMRAFIAAAFIVCVWNVQAQDGKDKLIPIIEAELNREI